jgi:hypothetical protein
MTMTEVNQIFEEKPSWPGVETGSLLLATVTHCLCNGTVQKEEKHKEEEKEVLEEETSNVGKKQFKIVKHYMIKVTFCSSVTRTHLVLLPLLV